MNKSKAPSKLAILAAFCLATGIPVDQVRSIVVTYSGHNIGRIYTSTGGWSFTLSRRGVVDRNSFCELLNPAL